jgi:hypothetical protein
VPTDSTPDELFAGHPDGLRVLAAVDAAAHALGDVEVRATKSQVAFRHGRRGFAYVWRPGQYVASEVPAVLSLALPRELASPRFKSVIHPSTRVWMHHLELTAPEQVDAEVQDWLRQAYEAASATPR